ncbi:hypothetical protein ABW19_dt0210051 [Dactylella cylindrospora]|nr:hypothetical protein ABW19_dt0210051 [Dactylella cylindrospora]
MIAGPDVNILEYDSDEAKDVYMEAYRGNSSLPPTNLEFDESSVEVSADALFASGNGSPGSLGLSGEGVDGEGLEESSDIEMGVEGVISDSDSA